MAFQWDLYEFYLALWEAPAYHLILEGLLLLWVLWLIFRKSYNPAEVTNLTEKEKEELIATWEPEPLAPTPLKSHPALNPRVVDGRIGKYINLDGKHCLNLASHNYLGLADSQELDNAAIKCLKKYGVGSCGPRGFYGTVDVHLELESRLAKFMNCEEAVLYSYGFSTSASAIPAYAKRGDVIFADEAVHFAIQKGLDASRSDIRYFRHNDVNHLRELLEKQAVEEIKNPKKAKVTRKFIVVEGVYMNTGSLCPLPDIVELKTKHKVRLFIDETVSFGTLGHTGRGITEYYGIPVDHVDLIMGSLEHALSSIGGFCVGTSYVVDHQRLSGLGYCFSASLPPMLAAAAMASLDLMEADEAIQEESKGSLFATLRDRCRLLHQTIVELAPYFVNETAEESPIKHLHLGTNYRRGCRTHDEETLRKITEEAAKRGVAVVVAAQLPSDRYLKDPSIRITVNRLLTDEEIRQAVSKLHKAAESILEQSLGQ